MKQIELSLIFSTGLFPDTWSQGLRRLQNENKIQNLEAKKSVLL